ncbi:carboxy-S-adenosyl-L-methionine synthase CmoA [Ningiella sp. W23]|uniref:carboxy-S-adenosyl-L-methionine synthase CmoA n=1 Tax=Ningiella sp. W23 TaxID=3023715 RepID=UPI003757C446
MTNSSPKTAVDTLYSSNQSDLSPFAFNQAVVDVFPDMINRSVPGYQIIVDGIGKISSRTLSSGATVYDLGCSLGAVSLSIAKHCQGKALNVFAVDNSEAMVERCSQHIGAFKFDSHISVQQADVTQLSFEPCDMIVINFTLQFIDRDKRQALVDRLYEALKPGGKLIMSEKVREQNKMLDAMLVDLHHDFKKSNGYSELEISQKRSALENVMVLDDIETHSQRLRTAGFLASTVWYRHFNFLSMCAVK